MSKAIHVIIAKCLPADDWISISEYNRLVLNELNKCPGLKIQVCSPIFSNIRNRYIRALSRNIFFPMTVNDAISKSGQRSLLHITDQFYAFLEKHDRIKTVITCHDLIVFRHSNLSSAQRHRWIRRVNHLKHADMISADSQSTAQDIMTYLKVPESRICVNHLGSDPFYSTLPDDHNYSPAVADLRLKKTGRIFILHVGSNVAQKNIGKLIEAVTLLRNKALPVTLIKCGEIIPAPGYFGLSGTQWPQDMIINTGYIAKKEVLELYNTCDMLAFPSLYEGFGFPIIEAQQCGLPCISSDRSSLPEIGADSVLYCNPDSAEDIAAKIHALSSDPILKKTLRARGYINSRRFDWQKHISSLITIYEALIHSNHRH